MTRDRKILIKNIYYMLSYAFTTLQESVYEDIQKEEFENIHNLFAAILSRGISLQLQQGLYKEYSSRMDDLTVIRGKINMPGTIRNKIANKIAVTCEYDELSENNLMNQILKTTVYLLLKQPNVKQKYKAELKKEILYFANVILIDPTGIQWNRLRFHRNNRTYRMLLAICQLIIEGTLLTTEQGEYHLSSFIDGQRMNRLFEKFILEYYKQEYAQNITVFSASASQIPWQLDDGNDAFLPVIQTDITLAYKEKVLIIDAKYYQHTMQTFFDVPTIHSDNLYQIFTYVKNKEVALQDTPHEVSVMVLYAKTDEEVYPDNEYQMSGNRIMVKTLDLNREFGEIRRALDEIVKQVFGQFVIYS